ncbi:MAG: PfkB family carbohydrate kinase [Candidatus Parcubacteria bacterium]|nr:PfkB family carbohydrate kinase [Candidatus Parcubacteria bacterium]
MIKVDFLAIGDTVIDAFIKLKQAEVIGEPDTEGYKICLPFADKVPYEDVFVVPAVGNAANAAVSASRLGISSALMANIGDDKEGQDCLVSLQKDKVQTDFVKINSGMKTNYHYVLWYGAERTILIKHEKYNYNLEIPEEPKWIYFSSVSADAYPFHDEVADYLDAHPNVKLAFQPGKNEIHLGKEKLAKLYKHAEIFFCNVEEAEKILDVESLEVSELLKKMHGFGPKNVVITDGPKGAYAFDGVDIYFINPFPDPKPAYDRTGAGDAFSSTIVGAIILGKTLPEALSWAGVNAMSVVTEIGAQAGLLSREKIEGHLAQNQNYQARKI